MTPPATVAGDTAGATADAATCSHPSGTKPEDGLGAPRVDQAQPEKYVLDATMGMRGGLFCFCPVEMNEDGEIVSIITGMNYLSDYPPGPLAAIVHEDGQDAVEEFCAAHSVELDALKRRMEAARTEVQA